MKIIMFLLSALAVCGCAREVDNAGTGWARLGFKGRVKSVRTRTFGDMENTLIVFDEQGRIVEETRFSADDEPIYKATSTYDDNGVAESQSYNYLAGGLVERTAFESRNGMIMSGVCYNAAGEKTATLEYGYEGDNNTFLKKRDTLGGVVFEIRYEFDGRRPVSETHYDHRGEKLIKRTNIYEGDALHSTTEEVFIGYGKDMITRTFSRKNGLMTEQERATDDDGGHSVVESLLYEYTFDANGNWTTRVGNHKDYGVEAYRTERTIEYF